MEVVLYATGHRRYFQAARETVRSVLARTPFGVQAFVGPRGWLRVRSPRLRVRRLAPPEAEHGRSAAFLQALRVVDEAARRATSSHLLLLDADTVFVRDTTAKDVLQALGDRELAMVEQTRIVGGPMGRAELRSFAFDVMVPFFGPVPEGLTADDLVYYNAGVVLGRREAFARLAAWALGHMARAAAGHARGEHMVGDQDYLQYWVNVLQPGSCATLPWSWNHCEHWDEDFPRDGARILHFSNFCHGPRRSTVRRMRLARRRGVAALARQASTAANR